MGAAFNLTMVDLIESTPGDTLRKLEIFLYDRPIALSDPLRLVYPPPWVGHIPFAFWLMEAMLPRSLVELGTHSGNSYCAFLQALKELGMSPSCYAVDTWQGDPHAGYYGNEVFDDLSAHHDPLYGGFSRLLRMTFDDALDHFSDGSVDLLHIDGLHTYEAVSHDVRSWLPKMSSRSLLLMHDVNVRERDFGVWRVWEEVCSEYPSFTFLHSNGLGVAWTGSEPMPEPIAWLMSLSGDGKRAATVRNYFAHLGHGLLGRFWASWREGRMEEQASEIMRLNSELNRRDDLYNDELRRATEHTAEQIAIRDTEITRLGETIAMLEQTNDSERTRIDQLLSEITQLQAQLTALYSSKSWRITAGLRWMMQRARAAKSRARLIGKLILRIGPAIRRNPRIIVKAALFAHRRGLAATLRRINQASLEISVPHTLERVQGPTDPHYAAWLNCNDLSWEEVKALRDALDARKGRLHRISIIMPTYNTPTDLLDLAIGSVLKQIYSDWELCIADDASSDKRTLKALEAWAKRDKRIKVLFCREHGNISCATNAAASFASGEFLVFLDHDDELSPDALAEIAIAVADFPDTDYVYSDDDKIDREGRRFAPQFKPDWSPILLLSYMYMGHVKVVRRSLFADLGGFRAGFEGSQDYDFALRMSERARRILHIPKVLYHWRVVPGSTAASGDAKPASFESGRRAVAQALERRDIKAEVVQPKWAIDARIGVFALRFPNDGPKVAIIIPTRNHVELLRICIASLTRTSYRNYEIVIVDNQSDDPDTLDYLASLPHRVLRIANPPGRQFSFASINNEAVRQVDADYVLFLNNDTEVRSPEWLSAMMGYARMEAVGAVGARLLFHDETVQHAGIIHGLYDGLAGPAFRNAPSSDKGYLNYAAVAREYSAVTAACLLTPRALFLELGGFDEAHFAVAYNDVDYCYRIIDTGRRCIYVPGAELFHYEGKSRGFNDNPQEISEFRKRYAGRIDPWFNPNLSLDDEHFRVRPYHRPAHVTRPVRAIMVTHNLNHEGAPNSQLELVLGLTKANIIDPVVLSPVDGPLRMRYEEAGIEVRIIRTPLAGVNTLDAFYTQQDEIAGYLRDLGAEVVYGNTLQTFWAIDAGERAGLPTLWNVRESEPWDTYFDFLSPDLRSIPYNCFAYPYRVIFVAHATRQIWAPVDQYFNFTVIHNGLDLSRLETRLASIDRVEARRVLSIAPNDVAVVLVGTVCDRKGQIDLVRALLALPQSVAGRLRAFIVGDRAGDYSTAMHQEISRLPAALRARIIVEPETSDVSVYYRAADIALCTSRIESYPRVVLEAMASGLPLITTPVFGIREQIRENINGLFYEAGNAEALAQALTSLIENDDQRAAFAEASKLVLESLTTYPEMVERYGQIFREARFSRRLRTTTTTTTTTRQ
ncbi:glycosyltransferase [Acidithiobacillus caldus]|nr:glycosyltransferase [Acidithiobacillus caldus]MBU2771610.1 glycosyltransferase [Acidithiobacillus caldus]